MEVLSLDFRWCDVLALVFLPDSIPGVLGLSLTAKFK